MITDIKEHFGRLSLLEGNVRKIVEDRGFACEVKSDAYQVSPGCWENDSALVLIWKKPNTLGVADAGVHVSGVSKIRLPV